MMGTIRVGALVLALWAVAAGRANAADERQMTTASPRIAKFTTVPGLPSCATVAMLRGNPRTEASVVFVKLAPDCRVPWHWHTANEEILVVSGAGELAMKDGKPLQFQPGAYASLPSHHAHEAHCFTTCVFTSIADGAFDIHYVDEAGTEISEEQAMKAAVGKAKPRRRP